MKKLLTGIAGLLLSAAALATTFNPVQLLNPVGSTSGQVVLSAGPSSTVNWGNIPATALAAQAANTVVANVTGSSASPTAFAMPSCSTSASALNWATSTGFTCNTAVNAAQLGGQTFTSPTITTPTITGVTSGACAATGNIGECKNANVVVGSSVALTTSIAANVTSVSLTAGNWLCDGNVGFNPSGSTVTTAEQAFISTTSATAPVAPNSGSYTSFPFLNATGGAGAALIPAGMTMENVTSTTTVFLEALAVFTTSTQAAYGYINCIRWH